MDSIASLRTTLINVLSQRASPQAEQELFEELIALKSTLVRIFNVGPRRPQEQRDVESGEDPSLSKLVPLTYRLVIKAKSS